MIIKIKEKEYNINDVIAEKYIKYVGPIEDIGYNIDLEEVEDSKYLELAMNEEIEVALEVPVAISTYAKENNLA